MPLLTESTSTLELPARGAEAPVRRPVNWRSVLLGLVAACFINTITPYNDWALANTYFIGNFLPIGLLLFMLVVILVFNATLLRFFPRQALSTGELGVGLSMAMVSCAVPSSGLMRYLPANLVGLYRQGALNRDYASILESMNLPSWFTPLLSGNSIQDKANDRIVDYYFSRIPQDADAAAMWQHVLGAWITPALAWGVFIAAMYVGVLCMMVIVRRQWVENERLTFPLAGVYLSLIEAPPRGKAFNALFRSRGFWIACVAVFAIHSINAMYLYDPRHWPQIPIGFDFRPMLADPPWNLTSGGFRDSKLYFCVVGITLFLQTKIAFSLWFLFVLLQVVRYSMGTYQLEMSGGQMTDQSVGASVVFALMILWIGRHHWWLVLRQMFRAPRPDEAQGRYLPYFLAGWGLVAAFVVMSIWLMAVGVTPVGAVLLVLFGLMGFLLIARIVSETGLIFVQLHPVDQRMWIYAANYFGYKAPLTTAFMTYQFNHLFTHDMRETLSAYASQSFKVADESAFAGERSWKRAIPFTLCLMLALAVSYGVSFASMLWVEYSVAATLDRSQGMPNPYGHDAVKLRTLQPTLDFVNNNGPRETHNRAGNFAFGAAFTGVLAGLRMRYASWPLHPVGFLLVYTMPVSRMWFSIMVGWLLKVLIVKYGGAQLFHAARPVFIGMIIGEAGAAASWLMVGIVRVSLGLDFHAVNLLPI